MRRTVPSSQQRRGRRCTRRGEGSGDRWKVAWARASRRHWSCRWPAPTMSSVGPSSDFEMQAHSLRRTRTGDQHRVSFDACPDLARRIVARAAAARRRRRPDSVLPLRQGLCCGFLRRPGRAQDDQELGRMGGPSPATTLSDLDRRCSFDSLAGRPDEGKAVAESHQVTAARWTQPRTARWRGALPGPSRRSCCIRGPYHPESLDRLSA